MASEQEPPADLELFYFDTEGKGEPIRLAAVVGNVALKDTRLKREEFGAMKESGKLAFGQVPALRVGGDGTLLVQSAAILKFVGKQGSLYPTDDDVLAARIDALLDEENDLFAGLTVSRYPFRYGFDAVGLQGVNDRGCPETAKVRAALNSSVLPKHLTHLEAILAAGGTGWLAGTPGPTVADLLFAPRLCWMLHENDGVDPGLLTACAPGLADLVRRVYALPPIKDHYAARGKAFDAAALRLVASA